MTSLVSDCQPKSVRGLQIKKQLAETDSVYDSEKLAERIAKLAGGVAVIKVRRLLRRLHRLPSAGTAAASLAYLQLSPKWASGKHCGMPPAAVLLQMQCRHVHGSLWHICNLLCVMTMANDWAEARSQCL